MDLYKIDFDNELYISFKDLWVIKKLFFKWILVSSPNPFIKEI